MPEDVIVYVFRQGLTTSYRLLPSVSALSVIVCCQLYIRKDQSVIIFV